MRGLRQLLHSLEHVVGITPAHAGLTFADIIVNMPMRDHPRACGAYLLGTFIW